MATIKNKKKEPISLARLDELCPRGIQPRHIQWSGNLLLVEIVVESQNGKGYRVGDDPRLRTRSHEQWWIDYSQSGQVANILKGRDKQAGIPVEE